MAFSGNFMCTSFKQELLQAKHDFTNSSGDTYKLAMYTNSPVLMRLPQRTQPVMRSAAQVTQQAAEH